MLLSYLSYSQKKDFIPKNYTEFLKNPSNGKKNKRIECDFDNDGQTDIISVIHNKTYDNLRTNKKFLIVYLSSKNENVLIDFDIFYGVYFLNPKLKNKTLEFQLYQEGTGVYGHNLKLRYNNKYRKIELIGYDNSYRTPEGHCNKSYNLLTGNYNVINDFYDNNSGKIKIKKFKGYKKQTNKIFIEDFTNKLFEVLADVGHEYER